MKTRLFLPVLFLCCLSVAFPGGKKDSQKSTNLVIYAYDSFVADWGPGPELVSKFEAKTGYSVTMLSCGDAAQALSRAVLEKKAPKGDVVIGIDNQLYQKAVDEGVLQAYKPADADKIIKQDLRFGDEWYLTPYDWSYFAIIWDSLSSVPAPQSLKDLTKPVYAKKLILMDPRLSTPGLGFVSWTKGVFGDAYKDYWKNLKPNVLTMAPGWDAGYGLFTAGEAPLVISYTTSPAYHVEYDNTDRYKALIFPEGHPVQIEGAGIIKGTKNLKAAQEFIDFLISEEAQSVLPLTQWMYPVNEAVKMPPCYDAAPMADKIVSVDQAEALEAVDSVLQILSK